MRSLALSHSTPHPRFAAASGDDRPARAGRYTGRRRAPGRSDPLSEDLKRFHGTNERLPVEGYADVIRFYRRLIENAAG
jgi:acetylornithine deacetylase/succinyl-diaminopimelate desuccinylase-like protein